MAVGLYLARREILRSNPWTTGLIVLVMMLTFFNMLLLGGILIGLAQAAVGSYQQYFSGDVLILPAGTKTEITRTVDIDTVARSLPTFKNISNRFGVPATLEYNWQRKIKPTDLSESASGVIVGIDPAREDRATHLSGSLAAGSFLSATDADEIVIGSNLINKYATARGEALALGGRILKTADVGSRVRLTVNGVTREVTIKGVITTNNLLVDSRIYMVDRVLRQFTGNSDLNATEIAVYLTLGASPEAAKQYLLKNLGDTNDLTIDTATDALPSSILTIFDTFNKLTDLVGGISLIVGAITIFIIIFVNAITRRKFIGILKGIGISPRAIEISYVIQALFYSTTGIVISSILIMGLIKPYFILHPLTFAIAPTSLDIRWSDVVTRAMVLTLTSFVSGLIPAYLVTKQNTLDAILGR